ncbi:hypothetical protein Desti_1003 [Desulfomonile tiedjei DSM 6799]|uniref:Uncharacterized protein n=1 Tax=Desulfomonile tiedjei (strain ATCC 49306 / DSM 6799 / DCB-1) TaxID=706587 RepID=I4C2D0_DESTA|nr:hypothetical protein Desti_1003 [Desulfomonile tiedjei DSM 6799]
MDSQASDPTAPKSGLTPLSEHPKMDRLADILKGIPADRKEAFEEWLQDAHEDGES